MAHIGIGVQGSESIAFSRKGKEDHASCKWSNLVGGQNFDLFGAPDEGGLHHKFCA